MVMTAIPSLTSRSTTVNSNGFPAAFWRVENFGHAEIRVFIGHGRHGRTGFLDADLVHDFEGAHDPPQSDLGPAIGVLDRGHPFIDQGGGHPETDAVEAIDHGLEFRFIDRAVEIPVLPFFLLRCEDPAGGVKGSQFVAQGGGGVHRDRNSGDVHQLEGAHPDLKGPLGGLLDGRDVGQLFFEHAGGFVQKGDEEAVDGKPGRVLDHDGGLAVQLGRQQRFIDRFRAGRLVGNDFQQPVLGRMVEIVQADEAVGPIGLRGELAHVKTRGVGGQDGFRRAEPVQFLEEVGLDGLVLEDRLDDQIGIGYRARVGRARDPGGDLLGLGGGKQPARHAFLQRLANIAQAALDEFVFHVHHDDLDPLLGDFLDNAAAHVAGADHADFFDLRHVTSEIKGLKAKGKR